jgi:hypothetical protein
MRRSHSPTETQVLFMLRDDDKGLSSISRAPIEQQKEFWAQRFRDAGWQADRFLAGLNTAGFFTVTRYYKYERKHGIKTASYC